MLITQPASNIHCRKIPGYVKSIPSYLPSWSSLPSLPSLSSDVKLVEYDAEDTDGWVTVPQGSSWSNLFGVNVSVSNVTMS